MTRCGFAKLVLNDLFDHPVGKDIEGRFLFVADETSQWLLASLDFSAMWRSQCLAWRRAISEQIGIPLGNIWLHTTQTHSAPEPPDIAKVETSLIEASNRAIRKAVDSAVPAHIGYCIANLEGRFNHNREQYIPGVGAVTVWQGWEYAEDGRAHVEDPAKMLLMDWSPDVPYFERRIYFDRPADALAALVVFRATATGEVLGTLSRFSAHPAAVSGATNFQGLMNEYRYHPDWPGYVRDALEQEFGGIAVFVNGPCGNVAANDRLQRGYVAGDTEARRLGEGIATACIAQWKESMPAWNELRLGRLAAASVNLPLRETIPASRDRILKGEDFQIERERLWEQRKAAMESGKPAYEIKDMTDGLQHLEWTDEILNRWTGLSDDELRARVMTVDVEAVALNELVFAGLPGESMTDTCMWLRAQSVGDRLIVFDQVNGYHVYLTSPEAFAQGGYSHWCSVVNQKAEPIMRHKALELIHQVRS